MRAQIYMKDAGIMAPYYGEIRSVFVNAVNCHGKIFSFFSETINFGEKGDEINREMVLHFPSSKITIVFETYDDRKSKSVIVEGLRGSIQDAVVPVLEALNIPVDNPDWEVETTRPEVIWYERTPENAGRFRN